MRTVLLLLLLATTAPCQTKPTPQTPTPKDDADIRAVIDAEAKKENQRGSGEVWSERGPVVIRVRTIESITNDVAIAEVTGGRTGAVPEMGRYVFILTRTDGKWTIAKRVPSCPGFPTLQPLAATQPRGAHGSSDCPN